MYLSYGVKHMEDVHIASHCYLVTPNAYTRAIWWMPPAEFHRPLAGPWIEDYELIGNHIVGHSVESPSELRGEIESGYFVIDVSTGAVSLFESKEEWVKAVHELSDGELMRYRGSVEVGRMYKSGTSFDDRGRVWRQETFSVNTSTGVVGSSLKSDFWYDSRGNNIKSLAPGGLVTKNAIDGAGRTTATYFSDGGGDTAYADADDVTGDKVLEERHNTYDLAGNVLLATSKLRFHDATATGALGDASTNPKARVSYKAFYYDKINRLTASVEVGTDGGSSDTAAG